MLRDQRLETLVIGAGIVGAATARFIQKRGGTVALIDKGAPGMGASYGHAGNLGISYVFPAASRALIRAIPTMMRDRNGPFVVRPRLIPFILPWFMRLVQAADPDAVAAAVKAAVALQKNGRKDWDSLTEGSRAAGLIDWAGMLEVCATPESLARMKGVWESICDLGFSVETLDADAVFQAERNLAPAAGGAILNDTGHTTDPLALTRGLVDDIANAGGQVFADTVRAIEPGDGGVTVIGERARYAARTVVIATGVDAPRLASAFGNRVPLVAERGYHIMLPAAGGPTRRPVTLVDRRVVVTPMAGGTRLTTMAEFTTAGAPPDYPRADRVFRPALDAFPALARDVASRWVGSRPSTPDSLPVIGRSPKHPSVFFAFGHGGKGLTNAATTGRVIAALIAGDDPGMDVTPFRGDR